MLQVHRASRADPPLSSGTQSVSSLSSSHRASSSAWRRVRPAAAAPTLVAVAVVDGAALVPLSTLVVSDGDPATAVDADACGAGLLPPPSVAGAAAGGAEVVCNCCSRAAVEEPSRSAPSAGPSACAEAGPAVAVAAAAAPVCAAGEPASPPLLPAEEPEGPMQMNSRGLLSGLMTTTAPESWTVMLAGRPARAMATDSGDAEGGRAAASALPVGVPPRPPGVSPLPGLSPRSFRSSSSSALLALLLLRPRPSARDRARRLAAAEAELGVVAAVEGGVVADWMAQIEAATVHWVRRVLTGWREA